MRKYIVERTIPGAGQMDTGAVAALAAESDKDPRDLGPDIRRVIDASTAEVSR